MLRIRLDPLAPRYVPVPAQVAPDLVAGSRDAVDGVVEAPVGVEIQQAREVQRGDRRERDSLGLRLLAGPECRGQEQDREKGQDKREHEGGRAARHGRTL